MLWSLQAVKDDHILENEEVGMISGALDLKQKTVKQIMKKIADVFMLPVDSTLDYKTMRKIELQGTLNSKYRALCFKERYLYANRFLLI